MNRPEVERACRTVRELLLAARGTDDHWTGRLSASALATATAASALSLADRTGEAEQISRALDWLCRNRNPDGGWGDTTDSRSNVSTTGLVLAAFALAGRSDPRLDESRAWLERSGGLDAVIARYGRDRTFSAPIVANLALAGLADWGRCPELPFQLAALPPGLWGRIGLPVVSYALPALIAVGLAQFVNSRAGRGPVGAIKRLAEGRALRRLEVLTPPSGGYLEATPLTAFVAMSLIAAGRRDHPALARNLAFLRAGQAPDGSWRIEADLGVWLTTLSVNALGGGDEDVRRWLLACQTGDTHPYTGAAAGAWAWTDRSGGVPDADDTAGAVLALATLPRPEESRPAALAGVKWLLDLQNSDGGWPTFCRGWSALPFDRSAPDLTAHALRAFSAWRRSAGTALGRRMDAAAARGLDYLRCDQRADGSWLPLWFGNEDAQDEANPVYGTSRVLLALSGQGASAGPEAVKATAFLTSARNADGSWGGAPGVAGSVEETALAVEALACCPGEEAAAARAAGVGWLCRRIADGGLGAPAPIGLYFAKLWYHESLYPPIFCASALRRVLAAEAGFADASATQSTGEGR